MTGSENLKIDDRRRTGGFDIAYFSGIGKRDSQQDSGYLFVSDDIALGLVCDGMGGHEGGRLASQTAVDAFAARYHEALRQGRDFLESWITDLENIDDMVYSIRRDNGERLGAGTTLALLYIQEDKLFWLSVGDSRIYLSRGIELVQVTTDHNYFIKLKQQLDNGIITQEDYANEKKRGDALISFVGMGGLLLIDVNEKGFPLRKADTILICSDGVYRTVTEEKLAYIFANSSSADEAAKLINDVISARNIQTQDNYTYIIIRER